MKTFTEWLKVKEGAENDWSLMGSTDAIVTCKDLKNPNFQISGAMSDLKCGKKKKKKRRR